DTTLFWTAVPYTMQPAGAAHFFAGAPPEAIKAFGADRAAMNPTFRRAPIADARAVLVAYLGRLAAIADVSAAQSIWYMRRAPPIATLLHPYPGVVAWFERVAALGHGESTAM